MKTPSYPSGHSIQGIFIAKVLSKMYPKHKKQLMEIGKMVSNSRLMARAHYPSDTKLGEKIGALLPHWFYHLQIFITMRKRHWKNRKNRPCPDCKKMLTYSRKDAFDRAVGNNSVCKSCAQSDRKFTLETIEKMNQPKTTQHKKRISKSISMWWEERKDDRESKWLR